MRGALWVTVCLLALAMVGCMHGRGEHLIPVSRDYKSLEKVKVCEAEEAVAKAHRVGAHNGAPFEYASSSKYLKWAKEERAEGDRKGTKDYAKLAVQYAGDAEAKGALIPDKGPVPILEDFDARMAEYDRLVARYKELDPCKAKLVAPDTYAHIETHLSIAEHELVEKYFHSIEANRYFACVEADIDAIWAKDTDEDGVKDMQDGQPWDPEDKDGFQDDDGIPEPKPYPILTPVHFASASAKLSAKDMGYLMGIAKMLVDGYSEASLYVEGHTDSDASDPYNVDLSERRAMAVQECLIENGAKPESIKMSFKGESQPVADNSTGKGKAQNRRVELWLDSPDVKSPFCN